MSRDAAQKIKHSLEAFYDIPFDIKRGGFSDNVWYEIKPQNRDKELFSITIRLKNRIRLVAEVEPEQYAAFSIQDMGVASDAKRNMFAKYAGQLESKRATIAFYVNDQLCDAIRPESWPQDWKSYKLRITRSPICTEDEEFNEFDIVSEWASILVGMMLALLEVTLIENDHRLEGGVKRIEANRYERNPVNRALCLAANGYTCKVCGFNFERAYGELGHHFIHVHHIVPVSKMAEAYDIDPVVDLVPVCPNCHAMLHRTDPPLHPDELKRIINSEDDQH